MEWNASLALDHGVMDETHQEFVALLNRVADASPDQLVGALDEFISHTEAHFAQEQKWMEQIDFPPLHCHAREHEGVLEIAREVRRRVAEGDARYGKVLAQGVAEWFSEHAPGMDAMLSTYMQQTGFTPTRLPQEQAGSSLPNCKKSSRAV